jgi:hypothetical protein
LKTDLVGKQLWFKTGFIWLVFDASGRDLVDVALCIIFSVKYGEQTYSIRKKDF